MKRAERLYDAVTGIRGDVDNSGEVDIVDVTVLQRVLAQIIPQQAGMLERGDVDSNSELDSVDCTLIQRYLVKLNPYHIGEAL